MGSPYEIEKLCWGTSTIPKMPAVVIYIAAIINIVLFNINFSKNKALLKVHCFTYFVRVLFKSGLSQYNIEQNNNKS